jgi:hypothetical protein
MAWCSFEVQGQLYLLPYPSRSVSPSRNKGNTIPHLGAETLAKCRRLTSQIPNVDGRWLGHLLRNREVPGSIPALKAWCLDYSYVWFTSVYPDRCQNTPRPLPFAALTIHKSVSFLPTDTR